MTFWQQIKAAAAAGVILGVEIVAVIAVVLVCSGWVFNDYLQIRRLVTNICQAAPGACQDHPPQPAAAQPAPPPPAQAAPSPAPAPKDKK